MILVVLVVVEKEDANYYREETKVNTTFAASEICIDVGGFEKEDAYIIKERNATSIVNEI